MNPADQITVIEWGDDCGPGPTLQGYRFFLYEIAHINVQALPPTAYIIPLTLGIACEIVNRFLRSSPHQYVWAVYNLATDRLINYAQDADGQTYWGDMRAGYGITNKKGVGIVSVGVVTTTFDQGTGVTLATPESLKNLTLAQLSNLQTPYGAAYLGIAASYGSTVWGLS